VTGPGGALEAATRAQEEGLVRAVGITGHGNAAAATHLEALRRHPFASVLTPLNPVLWQDEAFRRDYTRLVEEARRQDVGLMTIKTVSRRNWISPEVKDHSTWYEPITDAERIRGAVSWVLAHEEITGLATAGDVRLLGPILAAERSRLPVAEAESLLSDDPAYSSPFIDMPT
jgi:predicted aldo/keto reductase-like oxidoreductase